MQIERDADHRDEQSPAIIIARKQVDEGKIRL